MKKISNLVIVIANFEVISNIKVIVTTLMDTHTDHISPARACACRVITLPWKEEKNEGKTINSYGSESNYFLYYAACMIQNYIMILFYIILISKTFN